MTDRTYKGYTIATGDDRANVRVHDPRYPHAEAIYVATSVANAKKWVDAYRAGATWAVIEARVAV